MRRCIFAVVWMAVAGAVPALADYVRITVDVKNATPNVTIPPPPGSQGGAGAIGGAGQIGTPPPIPQGGFGGKKGFGFAGGAGFMGVPQNPNNVPPVVAPPTPKDDADHLWITIYLEVKGKPDLQPGGYVVKVDHQFGSSAFVPTTRTMADPNGRPPFMEAEEIKRESLKAEHIRRLAKLKDSAKKDELVDLAFWAWKHGLMKEFHATIDDLKKVDPKHKVVAAYARVQSQLKAPLRGYDPAIKDCLDQAKVENYNETVSEAGHYAIFDNLPQGSARLPNVKRRLARLEDALESFYYWFALQDKLPIPAMPRYRLVALLVNEPADFYSKHKSWGNVPMMADGFTPRRDNIIVLSAKHLGEAHDILAGKTQTWMQQNKLEPNELLTGVVWKRDDARQRDKAIPFAIIQTMVVVQKALEEDAERATISHEAVLQLLAASGMLPRNVVAPEWLQEGLAAYFERPLGAVYGAGGLPSWSNLVAFKYHKDHGLGQGRDILQNVITDRYFQIARQASASGDETKMSAKARADWERARATSWAFVYYLANQHKMDRLVSYANEIAQLPRDVELDQWALESAFAKAFGLGQAKNELVLDRSRLQAEADEWMNYITAVNLELPSVQLHSEKTRKANEDAKTRKPSAAPKTPEGKAPPPPPPPP